MSMFSGTSARNLGIWSWQQAEDAKAAGQARLDDYLGKARAALGQGFDQARTDLNTQYTGAIDRLNPWTEAGKSALGTYQGSLGLGGQAERDAAVAAFQNSPGFQYAVDQASDATARKASALGALGSGNTMQAIADRAQNMQNQEYGNWQNQVLGISDRGQQAATTQAGLQGSLGNQLSSLGQNRGTSEAGLYQGFAGLGQNNLWQGTTSGINSVTNASNTARNNVASGLNFGINAISSGIGLAGLGMGGGSTLGGNLFNSLRNLGTGGLNYYK